MTQTTDVVSEQKRPDSSGRSGHVFLLAALSPTVALLIVTVFVAVTFAGRSGVSEYERQAIEVVSMQNAITLQWNQTVDAFNGSQVTSQREHIVLFTSSLDSVHDLITNSQSVIYRWKEIDVPDEHLAS